MSIGNRPPSARADGRGPGDLRAIAMTLGVLKWADPSNPPVDEPAKPAANGTAPPVEFGRTSVVPSRDHA